MLHTLARFLRHSVQARRVTGMDIFENRSVLVQPVYSAYGLETETTDDADLIWW